MNLKPGLIQQQLQDAGLPCIGASSDGRVDYSRALTGPETVLADSIISFHDPNDLLPSEQDEKTASGAKGIFRTLPQYATWTPEEAESNITNIVLGGKTLVQVNADIDALANSVAGMKIGLKTVAAAIIDLRTVLAIVGKMIMLLRNVAIRKG